MKRLFTIALVLIAGHSFGQMALPIDFELQPISGLQELKNVAHEQEYLNAISQLREVGTKLPDQELREAAQAEANRIETALSQRDEQGNLPPASNQPPELQNTPHAWWNHDAENDLMVAIRPNPTRGPIDLILTVEEADRAEIGIYSTEGVRLLEVLASTKLEPGTHRYSNSLDHLAAGTYLAVIRMGKRVRTLPIIVQ